MSNILSQPKAFTFLSILLLGIACKQPVKKELPKEKEHPKLIKTIGNPLYGNVQYSLEDKAGNLWFGTTENGLYKYDGKSFHQFLVSDGLNSNAINHLLEDNNGKLWIGTDKGLCFYDGKAFNSISIPLPKNLPPNKNELYKTQIVFHIIQDQKGKLWVATIDGVYVYDGVSFTHFVINKGAGGYLSTNHNIERMLEDKDGNIWFGGRNNVGVYRYDGKSITNFKLEAITLQFEEVKKEVSHNWAWPQLQDKKGNIWFSNWGGAYCYHASLNDSLGQGKTFTRITKKDGLPGYNGIIKKIIEDNNGNLWFGGDVGISRYNNRLNTVAGADSNDEVRQGKSFTNFRDGLINPDVWTMLIDKNENLWVGTRATGLYLFDARLNGEVAKGTKFINYSEYKR